MREIRFRGWEREMQKMVYDTELGGWIFEYVGNPVHVVNRMINEEDYFYDLMQYTGLKDKNGTEIYEGDILRCDPDTANEDVKVVEYVASEYDGVGFKPLIDQYYDNGCLYSVYEVIGNIYENPELLLEDE